MHPLNDRGRKSAVCLVDLKLIKRGSNMKLTYNAQMTISVVIVILANVLTDALDFWIYRSIGFGLCGLIWIVHPVAVKGVEANKRTIFWTRIAGLILILIGIFTRVHHYE
jgi:hypothetical protein